MLTRAWAWVVHCYYASTIVDWSRGRSAERTGLAHWVSWVKPRARISETGGCGRRRGSRGRSRGAAVAGQGQGRRWAGEVRRADQPNRRSHAAVSHRELTTVLTTDDDSGAARHLHLHNARTHIVPGRAVGLCLRIRRLGVRIPSVATPSGATCGVSRHRNRSEPSFRVRASFWAAAGDAAGLVIPGRVQC